jgi:hypothetical protein
MQHVRARGNSGLVDGIDLRLALDHERDVVEARPVELERLLRLRARRSAQTQRARP